MIADRILRSLNPPNSEIDKKWIETAKRRASELYSGKIRNLFEI